MWFRKPPPSPIYKRKPIATAAVILTMVGMFVLGPVGVIYNGVTEELKSIKIVNKESQGAIIQNQLAIKELLTRQQMILKPEAIKLEVKKLTPVEYLNFIKMTPEQQAAYKKYRTDITVWP